MKFPSFFKLSMNNFNKELTAKTVSHEYDEDENLRKKEVH